MPNSESPEIDAVRLSPALYAPFGDVIVAAPRGEEGRLVNQGTARRWDYLTPITNLRGAHASLNVSLFRCSARAGDSLPVLFLEKHPCSSQLFLPMNATRYLVIVALGGDAPDLSTLAAFIAHGTEGVSYRPGVWHHPMIALESAIDFSCLVWEDGSEDDCSLVTYPPNAGGAARIRIPSPTA